ncbi:hypothetical protein GCM10010495_55990 [Kitasatospora herbaricolor]|nr:hypothetical protein GCM10010495_55990 [Kitasatospora herbaricolor]
MFDSKTPAAWRAGLLAAAVAAGALTAGSGGSASALAGDTATAGSYAYTVKLDIGTGKRACTGALIDRIWVATAASCFAENPAPGFSVPAGAPAIKTTATIGRTDLTTTAGHVVDIVELVPRADRDLVLARLATPVDDVTPLAIATAAPATGESLRVAGFGRTKTEWVPNQLHTAAFRVDAVKATGVDITGTAPAGASVCKGDTGGPAVREVNGKAELAAISSTSWQNGCLGSTEAARNGAFSTRTDDVAGWIQQTVLRAVTDRDANGDGRADLIMPYRHADGAIGFYTSLADAAGKLQAFNSGYTVPAGNWDWASMKLVSGDFNGDHRTDLALMYHHGDNSISLRTGLADANGLIQTFGEASYTVPSSANWDWNAISLFAGDANGDGRADLIMPYRHADGAIGFYTSLADAAGKLQAFNSGYTVPAGNWDWASMKLVSGDFNGDHRTDLALMYHHGDNSISLRTGLADANGLIQTFGDASYTVPSSANWDWNAISLQ